MKKNIHLWATLAFVLLCYGVFRYVRKHPDSAHTVLNFFVFGMAIVSILLLVGYRLYRRNHSSVGISRLCEMVLNLDVPAFIWADDMSTLFTNEAMDEILGISESEDPGDSAVLLTSLFYKMGLTPRDAAERLAGRTYRSVLHSEGSANRYISWSTTVMKEGDFASLYFTTGFETTELVNAKQSLTSYAQDLAASESRYALSMKLSGIGILLCESIHDVYYVSEEAKKFLGIDTNEITFSDFRMKLHPDDRLEFDNYLNKIRNTEKTTASSKARTMELRIRASAGTPYIWYSYHYHENLTYSTGRPIIGGALIDITGEKYKDATIERLAFLDETTEIANRNKLLQDGPLIFDRCKATNTACWIIVLDIDRFHIINDSTGYENGDKILRNFAHILCKYSTPGGFAARVGADNFVLIVHDYSDYGDEDLPRRTIERIRLDMAEHPDVSFSALPITCSAGYARIPSDGDSFMQALEHAEFALAMGKGELSYMMGYDATMHQEIVSQGEMENELATAISRREFLLYYQPKVDMHTKKIIGAEALIRWIKPDGTMVSPNVFIPIAERTGMISEISRFVLEEACSQNALWQKSQFTPIVMSINFASGDFYQKNICETIRDVLVRSDLDSKWLELELTERLALGDVSFTIQQMNALREMGILLAMDDFGTGYSSLSYLQQLPLTLLKLDRSFIVEIETDMVAQEIVSAVIKIAKSMKIETIAEGVEFEGQAKILRDMGCDYVQGYLYGKPMPADRFAKRLAEQTVQLETL